MKIEQALREALNKLPTTVVDFCGDRMTINDVLYELIVQRMDEVDRAEVATMIRANDIVASSVADVDEDEKVPSAIIEWAADLNRWTTEPDENDIWPEVVK